MDDTLFDRRERTGLGIGQRSYFHGTEITLDGNGRPTSPQIEALRQRESMAHAQRRTIEKLEAAYQQTIEAKKERGDPITDRDLMRLHQELKEADPANLASAHQLKYTHDAIEAQLESSMHYLSDKASDATKADFERFAAQVEHATEAGIIDQDTADHYTKQAELLESYYEAERINELRGNSLERPGAYPDAPEHHQPAQHGASDPEVSESFSYHNNLVDPEDFHPEKEVEASKEVMPAEVAERVTDAPQAAPAVEQIQQERTASAPGAPEPSKTIDPPHDHEKPAPTVTPEPPAHDFVSQKAGPEPAKADATATRSMPDDRSVSVTDAKAAPAVEQPQLEKTVEIRNEYVDKAIKEACAKCEKAMAEARTPEKSTSEKEAPGHEHQDSQKPGLQEHHEQAIQKEQPTMDKADDKPAPAAELPQADKAAEAAGSDYVAKAVAEACAKCDKAMDEVRGPEKEGAAPAKEAIDTPDVSKETQQHDMSERQPGEHHSDPQQDNDREAYWEATRDDDDFGRD